MKLSEVEGFDEQIFGIVKFTSRVDSFLSGVVYMNNLRTYIDMEKETGIKGMGDKLEAARVHSDVSFKMYKSGTDELVFTGTANQMSYRQTKDEMTPVFCMFAISGDNLLIVNEDEDYYYTRIDMSETEINDIAKDFGGDLVLVNPSYFMDKLESKLKSLKYSFKAIMVKYDDYGINYSDRVRAYEQENHEIFFWKDKRFGYQHEYRVVLFNQMTEDGISIDIGDISEHSHVFRAKDFFKNYELKIKKEKNAKNQIVR